jgi:flagellar basal-body rod modification protein FlgD
MTMASAISGLSSSTTTTGTSSSSTTTADPLANKATFLNLLVAQLKNQDPLNPTDGTQFVSQLAQFSELEQVLQLSSDVGAIRDVVAPEAATSTSDQTDTSTTGA